MSERMRANHRHCGMNDVVICEPLRTPEAGYLGGLAGPAASDLAAVFERVTS